MQKVSQIHGYDVNWKSSHTCAQLITHIIDHCNLSGRIIDQVSHNYTRVAEPTVLSSRLSNDRLFEKLFMAILFILWVFARNLLKGNRRRNTFCILCWYLVWGSNPDFTSNQPTHYLLDYGDFTAKLVGEYNLLCFRINSCWDEASLHYVLICTFIESIFGWEQYFVFRHNNICDSAYSVFI